MAGEGSRGSQGAPDSTEASPGEADELPPSRGADAGGGIARTPLFQAQHSERYARQSLLNDYVALTGANLIVVIDQIFPEGATYLEELLFDCDPARELHVLLASPGGDGETAIRMVRSMQSRCSELTIIVPDMAKSAATLMCLGANHILMGPTGDLGPVDPQFPVGNRGLVSAKEIVRAVDEAEQRITHDPSTFPLFASLLSDVNMLMVEQARSALERSGALVAEALGCVSDRSDDEVVKLTASLKAPLIDDPTSHSAVLPVAAAREFGLPAEAADPQTELWHLVWGLWTRYFALGCFPVGPTAIYEGRRASHIIRPT